MSRSEFSFWCLWSAPLFVATDIRKLSGVKKEILTNEEVIAID
jgi:alpha-galactosidase